MIAMAAKKKDGKPDLRTRAGRRAEIIERVRVHGGYSIFWITDNDLRAAVSTEMVQSGELVIDHRRSRYPNHVAKIRKPRKKKEALG